jgi:hypothetical protein
MVRWLLKKRHNLAIHFDGNPAAVVPKPVEEIG